MFRILMILLLLGFSRSFALAQAPSKLDSYRQYLSKLDQNDPDSIGKSVREYHRVYAAKDDFKSQDASMDDWWKFDSSVLDRLGEADALGKISGLYDGSIKNDNLYKALDTGKILEKDQDFEKAFGRQATNFLEKIFQNGMIIYSSEGAPYIDFDPDFVNRAFSAYLSPSEKEFTRIRMLEFKEGFSEDAGLEIPWDGVRKRIVAWDEYLKKFPDSKRRDGVEDEIKEYAEVYLSGMDNSRTCEEGDGPNSSSVFNSDLKKSYETFLAQNKTCQYYNLVSDYYRALEAHSFKCNEVDVNSILSKYGLSSMSAIQPMLR